MAQRDHNQPTRAILDRHTTSYIRDVLHAAETPPPISVRYFYTSPLAIDDPLSPVPPPLTGSPASFYYKSPPRAFSLYDNKTLDEAWVKLRKNILKYHEELGDEKRASLDVESVPGSGRTSGSGREISTQELRSGKLVQSIKKQDAADNKDGGRQGSPQKRPVKDSDLGHDGNLSTSLQALDPTQVFASEVSTTGNPFIRAPSRSELPKQRPNFRPLDSYDWDDELNTDELLTRDNPKSKPKKTEKPSAKVPVGVSRLHEVLMPQMQMEPIYWSPLNDIAPVIRGTWFYKDSMLPVEPDVANLLESGYIALQPWTETWHDELNSAVDVGAIGEEKITHQLWPEKRIHPVPSMRPSSSTSHREEMGRASMEQLIKTPEQERELIAEHAGDIIDVSTVSADYDNKSAGVATYGRDGRTRKYLSHSVIYANDIEAYLLTPKLRPSHYYGRRPLANYIRKGHAVGTCVVRGFNQRKWDKLYPSKKTTPAMRAAEQGTSSAQAGVQPSQRQKDDPTLALSERPVVTDLVLVIHGIGQKLSERVESYHFTHAINAFRREIAMELGSDPVKPFLRKEMGGIMILPVNWRHGLKFEHGGYRKETTEEEAGINHFKLDDITPEGISSVRQVIGDVLADIPFYMSQEHGPRMVEACIREANRIYRLWCANNPGFAETGRTHVIAHSLGTVMAQDILSNQPTHVPAELGDPSFPEYKLPTDHFIFDTRSLFFCGSPAGFFLLLHHAQLLPRRERGKPGAEDDTDPGVTSERGTYGCLAVDNIYNIVNPYDPVAYRMNAAVDVQYAAALQKAWVPSTSQSWNFFRSNASRASIPSTGPPSSYKPAVQRLPSNVELETHNFTKEEVAEKRAFLLNDYGQIDWLLKYGGGPLEIQYLTMLGAHSSYWLSRDFVRMIVLELGREPGRDGTLMGMRAGKKVGRERV